MKISFVEENKDKLAKVIKFFDKYLDKDNNAIISKEFLCPEGLKASAKKGRVVVCTDKVKDKEEVIAAMRFYPRKREKIVSLYQFAIAPKYRGKQILKKMFYITEQTRFESQCPASSDFNRYYSKTGRILKKTKNKNNYWHYFL